MKKALGLTEARNAPVLKRKAFLMRNTGQIESFLFKSSLKFEHGDFEKYLHMCISSHWMST